MKLALGVNDPRRINSNNSDDLLKEYSTELALFITLTLLGSQWKVF